MADSDDEYVQDISDDDADAHIVRRGGESHGTRASGKANARGGRSANWEVTRTWENVVEGADGTISGTVDGLLEAGKRKRLLKDTTPLQRGIIRHLILIIDLGSAMKEKDLWPSRYLLTLRYAVEFVHEFFEQNPISQLGIIGMRDGLAVRVSDMSGNPNDHVGKLQALREQEPKGDPSLQNALEMARAALFHAPSHGTREVLLIFGSLLTNDPKDIQDAITGLVESNITCVVIGLAAEIAICKTLVTVTHPKGTNLNEKYGVALNEQHFRDLFMQVTTPPATAKSNSTLAGANGASNGDVDVARSSLLMMGFPSRMVEKAQSLCACHSKPTRGGYLCSRCSSKVCSLPTTCPACGLTLILSTHLARSYHHLFPLRNWNEVSWKRAALHSDQSHCFGCQTPFPPIPTTFPSKNLKADGARMGKALVIDQDLTFGSQMASMLDTGAGSTGGVSESARYECGTCQRFFCIDCDVFAHEVVHNCPGCQSREGMLMEMARKAAEQDGMVVEG